MKHLLLLITLFITTATFAQETMDTPLSIVEKMPSYKGGEKKRVKFISKNIKYPIEATNAKVGGISYITFVVEADGRLTEMKVVKPNLACPLCDEEALRVTKLMPKWIPGEKDGKKVRVQFLMPIKFTPR